MNGVRKFATTIALAGLVTLAVEPCVTSAHEIAPAQQTVEVEGLTIDLLRCERSNQATKCYLRITDAKQGDYCQLMAKSARAFDFAGNEYIAKETQIGSQTGRGPGISLVRGIPVSASVTFRDMQSAKDLAGLEIIAGGRGCAGRVFQFRDVAITVPKR
ncbi:hypothetical protein BST81_02030 [Leptolyngbya sp. 'hensonii']|nr:hypothetical protein BST81_02030 [Leptolyngbya sp. 'hensonii']